MQIQKAFNSNNILKAFVFFIFLVTNLQANAQTKFTDNLYGSINYHTGYNLPEYPFFSTITQDYIRAVDINFYKETVGKNKWEQLYNYPSYGISIFYSTLGNDEIFGRELALTYFFKIYLLSKNRFRLFNRTGIGLSYVNRKIDLNTNYLNVAVGSNINIHFNMGFGADYELTEKIKLIGGLSFDHFSNANTNEINMGINYLTGYCGLGFSLGNKTEKMTHNLDGETKKNSSVIFASIGGKHSRALTSDFFFTNSISYEFSRIFAKKFQLGIGGDIFYDSSVELGLKKINQSHQPVDNFQSGIHLTQSIVYNKFTFSIQEGIYLLLTEKVNNYFMYNRGIVQYRINNNFLVRIAMKSHLHILDYPEIGFGYKFNK